MPPQIICACTCSHDAEAYDLGRYERARVPTFPWKCGLTFAERVRGRRARPEAVGAPARKKWKGDNYNEGNYS